MSAIQHFWLHQPSLTGDQALWRQAETSKQKHFQIGLNDAVENGDVRMSMRLNWNSVSPEFYIQRPLL